MVKPDIENLIVLLFLLSLFFIGLKRKRNKDAVTKTVWSYLTIDKNTSVALKGMACVFVLMGHFGTWLLNTGVNCGIVTIMVTHTTANIALAWFMFFSGYGLSLKSCGDCRIIGEWIGRLKKLYLPLFYVCIIAAVMYFMLPEYTHGTISPWYDNMHHIDKNNVCDILYQSFGLSDWYVVCILYFISLFYFAVYLAKKTSCNLSVLLGILLLCYILVAYLVYGQPQAHYYRYPWSFMLGHLVASHNRNIRKVNIVLLIVFFLTWGLLDKYSILSYLIAIMMLACVGYINMRYEFNGKFILFIGGLSYFFYLSHERIGWPLIVLSGIENKSLILWIVVTILCSIVLQKGYNPIVQKK